LLIAIGVMVALGIAAGTCVRFPLLSMITFWEIRTPEPFRTRPMFQVIGCLAKEVGSATNSLPSHTPAHLAQSK
jgi:hypothetical protein